MSGSQQLSQASTFYCPPPAVGLDCLCRHCGCLRRASRDLAGHRCGAQEAHLRNDNQMLPRDIYVTSICAGIPTLPETARNIRFIRASFHVTVKYTLSSPYAYVHASHYATQYCAIEANKVEH